jgi:hypothetical protein
MLRPPMNSRAILVALQTAAAIAGVTAMPLAIAQLKLATVPDHLLRPAALQTAERAATARPLQADRVAPALRTGGYSWAGSAVQLELPRDAGNGTYTRPRLIVGVPSESMRNLMKSAGVETKYCMLPMLRARANAAELRRRCQRHALALRPLHVLLKLPAHRPGGR